MTELNGIRRRILTQVHLSVEERKKLELLAKEDERTMSDFLRKIIRDEWRRRGREEI